MTLQTFPQMQQSAAAALPGTWKLGKGRAITLAPGEAGILRVAHGCLWATFEGPHAGPLNNLGDHVVEAGGQLRLRAGERVVIEAWDAKAPAYFSWDPVAATVASPSRRFAGVVQPLADLRLAVGLGVGALGRLAAGLAGVALGAVAGRGREVLSDCAFNAQSRACRAHGAMS
jgi:hypothetical protein